MLNNNNFTFEQLGPENYFSYFSTKTYAVDTHKKCLINEALLLNTHNICFHREIR